MLEMYQNKRVLVTGHTGFKGSWLCLWLSKLGANVCGYALKPTTDIYSTLNIVNIVNKSVFGNILDYEKLEKTINDFKPEVIFHLAAQPLVRLSYEQPILTYQTNVIGSVNVLEAARKCRNVKAVVNVTTDKCYENKETTEGYKETDVMGGFDMYSSSKACVEIMSSSYRRSFLQENDSYALATARAGNVIGGGDWAKDRLIPDCVRAINEDKEIELRNPLSVRPWQFVLEPLSGYLLLGAKLLNQGKEFAQGYNFGPQDDKILTVEEIVKEFLSCYGKGNYTTQQDNDLHEANLLTLNIEKAKKELGWQSSYDIHTALQKTAEWYKNYYSDEINMYEFSIKQIEDYEEKIKWNKN